MSYYDEIGNVTYDQKTKSINFSMPFNYDLSRLNDPANSLFIHQELEIPLPGPLSAEGGYQGFANDMDVTNVLKVDGNNKARDIVHFMLGKPVVLQPSKE